MSPSCHAAVTAAHLGDDLPHAQAGSLAASDADVSGAAQSRQSRELARKHVMHAHTMYWRRLVGALCASSSEALARVRHPSPARDRVWLRARPMIGLDPEGTGPPGCAHAARGRWAW